MELEGFHCPGYVGLSKSHALARRACDRLSIRPDIASTVGAPTLSKPVTSAMRVTPARARNGSMLVNVRSRRLGSVRSSTKGLGTAVVDTPKRDRGDTAMNRGRGAPEFCVVWPNEGAWRHAHEPSEI